MIAPRSLPRDHPIKRLRRIAEVAAIVAADETGDRELADDFAWLATVVLKYDEGAAAGVGIAEASGLAHKPGATPWWETEALDRRDSLMRQARETFFGDLAVRQAAKEIITAAVRCSRQSRPPAAGLGKLLTEAARSAPIPRTPKTVRAILEMK